MFYRQVSFFFWSAVLIHAVIWIVLPGFFHSGYKPDVIEQLLIGREWVLSSYRHPALPALMVEMTNELAGRPFWSPFFVSQVCTVLACWGVWHLAKNVLNPKLALVPPLSLLLYYFFALESVKYNQNLPYIAFWTLAVTFVFQSLRTNKKRYWILTGLCIGLCLSSKFSAVLLVVSFLFYFIINPQARKTWRQPGPYLTTASAFLTFLPVLVWVLMQKRLVAPEYILNPDPLSAFQRLYMTSRFSLAQAGILFLPFIALLPILNLPLKRRVERTQEQRDTQHFLGFMIFVPFLLHILAGLVFLEDMNADYGAPLWTFLNVWLLLFFQTRPVEKNHNVRNSGVLIIAVEIVYITAFLVQCCYSPYLLDEPRRFHFPIQALGAECTRIWSEHADGNCPYLSGEWWLAGNAAEGMRPSPSVHAIGAFMNMDVDDAPTVWSTDNDVNRKGGIILWSADLYKGGKPKTLLKHFPDALILPEKEIPYQRFPHLEPVRIGIAVVLPPKTNRTPPTSRTPPTNRTPLESRTL